MSLTNQIKYFCIVVAIVSHTIASASSITTLPSPYITITLPPDQTLVCGTTTLVPVTVTNNTANVIYSGGTLYYQLNVSSLPEKTVFQATGELQPYQTITKSIPIKLPSSACHLNQLTLIIYYYNASGNLTYQYIFSLPVG